MDICYEEAVRAHNVTHQLQMTFYALTDYADNNLKPQVPKWNMKEDDGKKQGKD